MKVKRATMIWVGHKDWSWPKAILVGRDGNDYGLLQLDEIAKEAFEKYKATQQEKDIYLVDYSYQGDVEVLE